MHPGRLVSHVALALSAVAFFHALVTQHQLPQPAMFLLTALMILNFGYQVLRARRIQRVVVPSQTLSSPLQWLLVAVAAVGLLTFVGAMSSALPIDPSGKRASSFNAEITAGECRYIYNRTQIVVRPLTDCNAFQRQGAMAFSGSVVFFGSAALWLAYLSAGFQPATSRP